MRVWNMIFHAGTRLSCTMRLGIAIGGFMVCIALQISSLVFLHSFALSTAYIIPTALSAWMFKGRGALLGVVACFFIFVTVNIITLRTIFWPMSLNMAFVVYMVGISLVAFALAAARTGLEMAHAAQYEQEKAQAQIALAYEHQQSLDQLKDQFLLNVSHELRTPLTIVKGNIELLREHHGQLDAAVQQDMLEAAFVSCDELYLMVNKMLDVAQVEYGMQEPTIEEVALRETVAKVVAAVNPGNQVQWKVCMHTIPDHYTMLADRQYIQQVLRNVLSNAINYTPPGSVIAISACLEQATMTAPAPDPAPPSLTLCIQDNGPGIPPDQIPLLFHKFVRLRRDMSGPVRGTGLGLYICKQLLERMGGRIWVESSGIAGEGCRFYITLPTVLSLL